MKFKVNDRVKCIGIAPGAAHAVVGDTGKIIKIEHKPGFDLDYLVKFDQERICYHGYCGREYWCHESMLELISEHKFKVGDKVIAHKDAPYGITTNGWTGFVLAVSRNDIRVGTKSDIIGYWVSARHFDLVPTNKIVITSDGKTTTAKLYDGDKVVKTAEAKCSPDDTYNFEAGAKLAFERLTEKFAPSVKVKVIGNSCCHGYSIGDILTLREKIDGCGKSTRWHVKEDAWYVRECDIEPAPEEPEKFYNGKVVCVDNCGCNYHYYTVGKIYQFKDGHMIDDQGEKMPGHRPCKTFEDWQSFSHSKFIEVKE